MVLVSMAVLVWLDFSTGWEFSLFPLYAVPILLAIWTSGIALGILVAFGCGIAWWWANASVHPYTTQWGYPLAAACRWIYFAFVVVAGAAVRKRQLIDATAIEHLASLKAKEAAMNAVCEHELRQLGRSIEEVLGGPLRQVTDTLDLLSTEDSAAAGGGRLVALAQGSARDAFNKLRAITDGILPSNGTHCQGRSLYLSLAALVKSRQSATGPQVELAGESAEVTVNDPMVSKHFYRIAQEAVDNAIRHSLASHIWVSLQGFYDHVELRVDDNGRGMPPASDALADTWLGIKTMYYRADALGAHLSIQGRPGGGTSVACRSLCVDSMNRSF